MKRPRITKIVATLVGSSNSVRAMAIHKSEKKETTLMKRGFFSVTTIV